MQPIYYEDVVPGEFLIVGSFAVDRDAMVEFARQWDPMPIHVDEAVGQRVFGSLTAPGIYIMAIKQFLIRHVPLEKTVIASTGYDEVRFMKPVRPGDVLRLKFEWIEKRPSQSKPDRGIVKCRLTLLNQKDEAVMSHLDTVLMRLRAPAAPA
ncbi:MAG: MaoC/PaaZ C-terminal domain-containing protein [Alphaproteobacteria bacterium]